MHVSAAASAGPHRVSWCSARRTNRPCILTSRTTTRTRGAMTPTPSLLRSLTSSAPTSAEGGFTGARRAGRASPRSSTAARSTETAGASSAARCVQSATRTFAWHWSRTVECATLDHHFLFGLQVREMDPQNKFASLSDTWSWEGVDLEGCCGPDGFSSQCQCRVSRS